MLTAENRANLEKLATYLEGLPKRYRHFNMNYWIKSDSRTKEAEYALRNGGVASCGTVACAVGHGPAAGVLVPGRYIIQLPSGPSVSWWRYSEVFAHLETEENPWCFAGGWEDYDNHHWGAAARIRYVLANSAAPEGFIGPARRWRTVYAPYRIDAKAKADA